MIYVNGIRRIKKPVKPRKKLGMMNGYAEAIKWSIG
jgi:hypothetical protein